MKIEIPAYVKRVIDRLEENGFEAYIVGGCVRDSLLGKKPDDYDVCTSCTPQKMQEIFSDMNVVGTGISHGTLTIILEGKPVETTTYRSEGKYVGHRKPESVTFEKNLSEDLKRRDFTVNALCYNDKNGLVDMFGGAEDIEKGIIRCVGEPSERFDEDALRIMRGLRFSSCLGFEIEKKTSEQIKSQAYLLKEISAERVFSELKKLLVGKNAGKILMDYRDVFAVIIPELKPAFDFPQKCPHHCYDVYQHICHSVDNVAQDTILRLTMLLHDIGKPEMAKTDDKGVMHFKKHQFVSADKAYTILRRLKCDRKTLIRVTDLVREHDNRIPPQKKSVKKMLAKYGSEFFAQYLAVRRADTLAQSEYMRAEKLEVLDSLERLAEEIEEESCCLKVTDLDVNGNDIISLGFTGKKVGEALEYALDGVIDEKIKNEKEDIIRYLKETFN